MFKNLDFLIVKIGLEMAGMSTVVKLFRNIFRPYFHKGRKETGNDISQRLAQGSKRLQSFENYLLNELKVRILVPKNFETLHNQNFHRCYQAEK